ncbi:MAG: proteic killer suppression protein [Halieaceae bacterium]|jgi:proteic killer suppression protein
MIQSFRCKNTERLFGGLCSSKFRSFRAQAERKLILLHSAETLEFLKSPPGNRLERLTGDRQGQWSIRINQQWRLCFRFDGGNAYDVEIVDYH